MKKVTEKVPTVSRKGVGSEQNPDTSVMLGCYDVWSATPDNDVLCIDLYPQRESDETAA